MHIVTAASFTLVALLLCTQMLSPFSASKSSLEHPVSLPKSASAAPRLDIWSDILSRFSGSSEMVLPGTTTDASSTSVTSSKKMEQSDVVDQLVKAHAREALREKEEEMVVDAWKDYSLEALNGQTFILTAPPDLACFIKSHPKLSITVDGKTLQTRTKALSKGAWAIEAPQDVSYGTSVLTLRAEYQLPTLGKYPFGYQFAIHQDKSSFEKVKDLVTQEFVLVQDNMAELSTRMTTGLQQYIGEIQQQTLAVRDQAMKRVNDTKKALVDLSSREGGLSPWESKEHRLRHLKQTRKALRKQGKELVAQVEATVRGIQEVALQQYDDVINVIRTLPQWQQDTVWPVRAVDWIPKTAARRGLGNAQGLLKRLQGSPRPIDGRPEGQVKSRGGAFKPKSRDGKR